MPPSSIVQSVFNKYSPGDLAKVRERLTCILWNISPPSPVDTSATASTKKAYAHLKRGPYCRTTERLLIGQELRGFDYERPIDEPITSLPAGVRTPALLEIDLKDFDGYFYLGDDGGEQGQPRPSPKPNSEHDDRIFAVLKAHAAKGGLVGFCLHAANPFTGSAVDLTELADPNSASTPAGQTWRRSLDYVAQIIQRFNTESAAANPVVLFRPLHESNGSWFWWGQRGQPQFRLAWQGMFKYLTGTKGLHNLLWVYSAAHDVDGTALSGVTHNYPGADLVDIVGLDIYKDDLSDEGAYLLLVALGKPFGITEYGPDQDQDHTGAELPNDEVIQVIRDKYPNTVVATCWYTLTKPDGAKNNWQMSDKKNPEALLQDPWAITLP